MELGCEETDEFDWPFRGLDNSRLSLLRSRFSVFELSSWLVELLNPLRS